MQSGTQAVREGANRSGTSSRRGSDRDEQGSRVIPEVRRKRIAVLHLGAEALRCFGSFGYRLAKGERVRRHLKLVNRRLRRTVAGWVLGNRTLGTSPRRDASRRAQLGDYSKYVSAITGELDVRLSGPSVTAEAGVGHD